MSLIADHMLPEELYSADAVRAIDRYVIDQQGVDGFELMQAAAAGAFRRLMKQWPDPSSIMVLCGAGNNGGDGYLIAANAKRHGIAVHCIAVAPVEKLTGDARKALLKAQADGVEIQPLGDRREKLPFDQVDLIVDAMLGTGVTGAPREPFADVITRCNKAVAPVMAVDVPSGLDSTLGAAAGVVIRAELTVTFIALKAGLFTGQGPEACGRVVFESLDTDEWVAESGQRPLAKIADWASQASSLPRRPVSAHKGSFGHVLVVAGERGFGGAGIMAAEAAARCGAGMVTLCTRPEYVAPALARCPSLMVHAVTHGSGLKPLIDAASVIVCGPGIGQGAWGQQMLQQVVASKKPRILDADALNLLAAGAPGRKDDHVLTPHPGEAARLLGCTVPEVEADRIGAARGLRQMYGGVVLLKGAGTVIAGGDTPIICSGGNPGMATGGMGDVLAGMIGSLLGQLGDGPLATAMGATLHLEAARVASASRGFMGLLPTDVIDTLPVVLSKAENSDLERAGIRHQGV